MDGYEKDSGGTPAGPDEPGPPAEPGPEDGPGSGPEDSPGPEDGPGSGPAGGPEPALSVEPEPRIGAEPEPRVEVGPEPSVGDEPAPRAGIAGLKLGPQIVAACALAVIAAAACIHVAMLFLHVAPSNTLTKQHGDLVDEWIYPEFEQNWKLFAPNPLQQNVAVQARAELRTAEGGVRTTHWYDLSAQDGAGIDGNLLPSHTQQNELRRGWDFYVGSHDAQNRPVGLRGQLSEEYVRRIAYMRLEREAPGKKGDEIARVQLRSKTTNVRPPKWSEEKVSAKPVYRVLPWWSVTPDDLPLADAKGSDR
ncbi:DUF5819 family protein [Streptomyces luteocolor]|uniref:DUF5819 family protein n=1 Tax=Streptomyces luteocolor TaxID=285500 RepID=UPI000853CB6E|nr:DUF5819 family protein [Streptomyces luteocolor]